MLPPGVPALPDGRTRVPPRLVEVCFETVLFFAWSCILSICIFDVVTIDDKKLSGVLKKMGLTDIKGVEEVNIFKNDGTVIHITGPKSKSNFHFMHSL